MVRKGLVIDEPWISRILKGEKTWEMRSTASAFRGPFGLIRKGTGRVVGIATLRGVSGPYSNADLGAYQAKHTVGPDLYGLPEYKWRYAWELDNIVELHQDVKYVHKNGAVTWVELDQSVSEEIERQLESQAGARGISDQVDAEIQRLFNEKQTNKNSIKPSLNVVEDKLERGFDEPLCIRVNDTSGGTTNPINMNEQQAIVDSPLNLLKSKVQRVPQAKDGSRFTEAMRNARGLFTVGEKGDEKKISDYHEAISYLGNMPVAKWRRPNSNGNWGIVSAVDWVLITDNMNKNESGETF